MNHIAERFKNNSAGFWRAYRWLIVVFVFALFCDALSTVIFMREFGPEIELHPVIYCISVMCGSIIGPLLSAAAKAFFGVVVAIYCRRYAAYIFVTASIISFWAAWYNLWGMHLYVPGIFKWFTW